MSSNVIVTTYSIYMVFKTHPILGISQSILDPQIQMKFTKV